MMERSRLLSICSKISRTPMLKMLIIAWAWLSEPRTKRPLALRMLSAPLPVFRSYLRLKPGKRKIARPSFRSTKASTDAVSCDLRIFGLRDEFFFDGKTCVHTGYFNDRVPEWESIREAMNLEAENFSCGRERVGLKTPHCIVESSYNIAGRIVKLRADFEEREDFPGWVQMEMRDETFVRERSKYLTAVLN